MFTWKARSLLAIGLFCAALGGCKEGRRLGDVSPEEAVELCKSGVVEAHDILLKCGGFTEESYQQLLAQCDTHPGFKEDCDLTVEEVESCQDQLSSAGSCTEVAERAEDCADVNAELSACVNR